MARRRTTRIAPHNRSKVLQANIYSPRIVWYQSLRFFGFCIRWSIILACVAGIGYGVFDYVKKNFLQNPAYELRSVKLSANNAFDEAEVVTIAEIPLNESIFSISLSEVEQRLLDRPEVTSASVRRELPGSLIIDLTVRQPFAWVECRALNMHGRSRENGYLIDRDGYLYPCPAKQYDTAVMLPVIIVAAEDSSLLVPGHCVESKTMKRSIRLLTMAEQAVKSSLPWIDSVQPYQPWAMKVWTRNGIEAIFGLEDHQQQMENLLLSMRHASDKGMQIASINLIPERNLPVILRDPTSSAPLRVRPQAPAGGASRQ